MRDASPDFNFPKRLGFGCSGAWGKPWFSAGEATAIIQAALDGGVRHFDTAGFYSHGEAERRLGAVVSNRQDAVFISTKVGTKYRGGRAHKDFSERAIRTEIDASRRRLSRDKIDLVYLHGPSPSEQNEGLEALASLKAEGRVSLIGVCGEGEGLECAVAAPAVDVIMGAYNLFRRDHSETFRRAKERGMGVVAIAPLAQGLYRRDFFAPRSLADCWHLARAVVKNRPELLQARKARRALTSIAGWSPAQLALAFVMANRDIDVVVTTTTRQGHLDEAMAAAMMAAPPEAADLFAALALDGEEGGA